MPVIDTHCHLDLLEGRGIRPEKALKTALERGVTAVIQIATNLTSSRQNREFAARCNQASGLPEIYWTAGIHPNDAEDISDLDELCDFIRENRDDKHFQGVGETGLDYYHTTKYVENQKTSLARHLEIACELKLPISLHLRDDSRHVPGKTGAVRDALAMVLRYPGARGVLHCFTYGYEEARAFTDLGWLVSYSGVLTYKNAQSIQEGAVKLPLESLMVETDAPFLAPMPHRGQSNEPAYTVLTLDYLANLRAEQLGESPETVKAAVYENSRRFLAWKSS